MPCHRMQWTVELVIIVVVLAGVALHSTILPIYHHQCGLVVEVKYSSSKSQITRRTYQSSYSDICLVNFYSPNGKLGLHQDKSESEESLRRGLPVVSFSIGDSADFLYGDDRRVSVTKKVVLESGDVLIFGGNSRNIFHAVTTIHPMAAPNLLLEETNLRPGRLNLTFRQY